MSRYILEPEVAGQIGEKAVLNYASKPPVIEKLHYEFDDWLGDDLLAGFRCFICTKTLATAIEENRFSGYELEKCIITKSQLFNDLNESGLDLPDFLWLKITGNFDDDFFTEANGGLIISKRVLEVVKKLNLSHCTIGDYEI
jgi:hypothetical protein